MRLWVKFLLGFIFLSIIAYLVEKHHAIYNRQLSDSQLLQTNNKYLEELYRYIQTSTTITPNSIIDIPIYYINLERSPERKAYMENQFKTFNIVNYTRIPGIDGKLIKNQKQDTIQGISFINQYHQRPSEIGCALSHITAIIKAYTEGLEKVLILEDDCNLNFLPFWKTNLSSFLDTNLPQNWEIANLFTLQADLQASSYFSKFDTDNPAFSCMSYVINRKGMTKLLNMINVNNTIILGFKDENGKVFPKYGVIDYYLYALLNSYYINKPLFFPYNIDLISTVQPNPEQDYLFYINKVNEMVSNYITDQVPTVVSKQAHPITIYIHGNDWPVNFAKHILNAIVTPTMEIADFIVCSTTLDRHPSKDMNALTDQIVPRIIFDQEAWDASHYKNGKLIITTKLNKKLLPENIPSLYVPFYSMSFAEINTDPSILIKEPIPLQNKSKFCAFAYSNCDHKYEGVVQREKFLDLLQERSNGRVDILGKCKKREGWYSNKDMFHDYKFVIAFENAFVDGYITEKITNPMIANSIPIYLGDKNVGLHFNDESFINVRNFPDWDTCIDYILYLDSNDDAYNEKMNIPWLHENKLSSFFSWFTEREKFHEDVMSFLTG